MLAQFLIGLTIGQCFSQNTIKNLVTETYDDCSCSVNTFRVVFDRMMKNMKNNELNVEFIENMDLDDLMFEVSKQFAKTGKSLNFNVDSVLEDILDVKISEPVMKLMPRVEGLLMTTGFRYLFEKAESNFEVVFENSEEFLDGMWEIITETPGIRSTLIVWIEDLPIEINRDHFMDGVVMGYNVLNKVVNEISGDTIRRVLYGVMPNMIDIGGGFDNFFEDEEVKNSIFQIYDEIRSWDDAEDYDDTDGDKDDDEDDYDKNRKRRSTPMMHDDLKTCYALDGWTFYVSTVQSCEDSTDHWCGENKYNPVAERCCAHGDRYYVSEHHCKEFCDDVSFDPMTHNCCKKADFNGGSFEILISHSDHCPEFKNMCGELEFFPASQDCCLKNLKVAREMMSRAPMAEDLSAFPLNECCNGVFIKNSSDVECCIEELGSDASQSIVETGTCDTQNYAICGSGEHFPKFYDKHEQICCTALAGWEWLISADDNCDVRQDWMFCDGQEYNAYEQNCCDVYDHASHHYIQKIEYGASCSHHVCAGESFDPELHECCWTNDNHSIVEHGGCRQVPRPSEGCHEEYDETEKVCCLYDMETHFDHRIENIDDCESEYRPCTKNIFYKPSEEKCCETLSPWEGFSVGLEDNCTEKASLLTCGDMAIPEAFSAVYDRTIHSDPSMYNPIHQTCCHQQDPALMYETAAGTSFQYLSNSTCQPTCNGEAYNESEQTCCRMPSIDGRGRFEVKGSDDCEYAEMVCGTQRVKFEEHNYECCRFNDGDYSVFQRGDCCDGN